MVVKNGPNGAEPRHLLPVEEIHIRPGELVAGMRSDTRADLGGRNYISDVIRNGATIFGDHFFDILDDVFSAPSTNEMISVTGSWILAIH